MRTNVKFTLKVHLTHEKRCKVIIFFHFYSIFITFAYQKNNLSNEYW